MRYYTLAAILAILTAFSSFAGAQTASTEPNQDVPHFSTSTSYAKILTGAKAGQSTDVTVFEVSIPVTPRWSAGLNVLQFGPDGRAYLAGAEVKLSRWKTIEVDALTMQSSLPWLFAGGDAVLGPETAAKAVYQAKEAAESIIRYLEGRDLKEGRVEFKAE